MFSLWLEWLGGVGLSFISKQGIFLSKYEFLSNPDRSGPFADRSGSSREVYCQNFETRIDPESFADRFANQNSVRRILRKRS